MSIIIAKQNSRFGSTTKPGILIYVYVALMTYSLYGRSKSAGHYIYIYIDSLPGLEPVVSFQSLRLSPICTSSTVNPETYSTCRHVLGTPRGRVS